MNTTNPKKITPVGQVTFTANLKMTDDNTQRQKHHNDLVSALSQAKRALYRETGGTIKILIQPTTNEK